MKQDASTQSTARQIHSAVKEHIISGRYGPATRLTEQSLAAEFGTSRTPAREAMRMLAADGFLVFKPNSGSVVRSWTEQEIRDLFDVRVVIESEIAALSAARIAADAIDSLERIQDEIEARGTAQDAANLERIGRLNREFHRIVSEAADNARLVAMLANAIEMPIVQRTFKRYTEAQLRRSFGHHRELIDAFRAHDGAWARSVMSSHIHSARHALLDNAAAHATT